MVRTKKGLEKGDTLTACSSDLDQNFTVLELGGVRHWQRDFGQRLADFGESEGVLSGHCGNELRLVDCRGLQAERLYFSPEKSCCTGNVHGSDEDEVGRLPPKTYIHCPCQASQNSDGIFNHGDRI